MNRLRKLKDSAMFIELLLVLAAIIAVIGLASYVRLNGRKTPNKPQPVSKISALAKHIETIPDNTPPQSASSENSDVKGAHTDRPNTPRTSPDNTLPATICNSSEKASLLTKLNQAIETENKRYQSQLSKLTPPGGADDETLDKIVSSHKSILNQLEIDFRTSLSSINCTV